MRHFAPFHRKREQRFYTHHGELLKEKPNEQIKDDPIENETIDNNKGVFFGKCFFKNMIQGQTKSQESNRKIQGQKSH